METVLGRLYNGSSLLLLCVLNDSTGMMARRSVGSVCHCLLPSVLTLLDTGRGPDRDTVGSGLRRYCTGTGTSEESEETGLQTLTRSEMVGCETSCVTFATQTPGTPGCATDRHDVFARRPMHGSGSLLVACCVLLDARRVSSPAPLAAELLTALTPPRGRGSSPCPRQRPRGPRCRPSSRRRSRCPPQSRAS